MQLNTNQTYMTIWGHITIWGEMTTKSKWKTCHNSSLTDCLTSTKNKTHWFVLEDKKKIKRIICSSDLTIKIQGEIFVAMAADCAKRDPGSDPSIAVWIKSWKQLSVNVWVTNWMSMSMSNDSPLCLLGPNVVHHVQNRLLVLPRFYSILT